MWNRWSLSLVPKEVAFGILSVLLPLYVIEEINGNLVDLGLIFFMKSCVEIPAAVLWARWIDREGRCKGFIVISFLISGLMILLLTITVSVWSFLGLNVLLSIFYVAHVPASRVLLVESAPSSEWEGGLARHRLVLGIGGIVGLLAGALWITRLDNRSLMLLCGLLILASLILSVALIQDPPLMIERKIMKFERFVHLAEQADNLAYAPTSYAQTARKAYFARYPSPKPLILGILLFPLASSMVFTSLPIFFSVNIGASSSLIFSILLIKSITILIGYTLLGKCQKEKGLKIIKTASTLRMFFPILLLISGFLSFRLSLTLSSVALAIAGFTWPCFSVPSTVLWMEIAPEGTAGVYNACLTLGAALGSLLGGLIPSYYRYETLFVFSAFVYGLSLVFFALSTFRRHI